MQIIFYEKENGQIPVKDFLDTLNPDDVAAVERIIAILEKYGNRIQRPYSAPLGNGIFELRAKGKDNQYRVLYFFIKGDFACLTNACIKKTNETSSKEIELALKRKQDYERRNKLC